MAGSKPRKLSTRQAVTKRCAFAAYACESWFEHIRFVSSEDDEFAATLVRFLKSTNLLSWIEHVAKKQDLSKLIQTGHALNKYLLRRTQKPLPFGNAGKENQLFDTWSADLVRLVTKFGANLLASPSSIFSIVAPFCPEESAIRSQYANAPRSIRVSGLSARSWDDCYSTVTLPASTSAVACGASVIAVGMQDGNVAIYDQTTCQHLRTLKHGEAVKKLLFGDKQPLLVSAGLHKISVWNGWELHWTFELKSQLISTALTDEDWLLLATFRSNEMLIWEIATGLERERISWLDEGKENEIYRSRMPVTTAIASDQTLLAIAYRGQDVIVWDIENASVYDVYGEDEGSLGVTGERRTGIASSLSMMFSKASETKLLVVGYNDGMLSLFNIDDGTVQAKAAANAQTLASSDDGLTLACGNSSGSIQLF
jgi:WD40 repeat protein